MDGSETSSMLAFTLNEIRAAWLGRGPPGPCSIKAGIGHQIIVKYILSPLGHGASAPRHDLT